MKEPRRDAVNALNEAFQEAARLFTLAAQEQRLHADLETVATQTVQFSRVAERCSPAERRECLAATHVTGELVGSFFDRTRLPLRAVPLGFDPSSVTAIANDFSYQIIFSRQLQALGKPGDILWAFSTSGNSPNVLAAMETAKNIGITTVLFSNHDGGRAVLWSITFCIRRSHLLPGYRNCTCFIPTFSAKSLSCIAPETRVEL